ncbi:peptide-binding protein [Sporosarcina pasteurii]|uniref:Oligopeptide-binding protein AppA n=1 Tax=Sporosarcina pasteurii TaxID=1474 RepID=A0A380BJ93_SPOPA|nr:peptide-binding protein [Sporosarcina pasteurii]MDS9470679.1 peptide-binding protein [Sporosarcina pasteurii]SUJ01456.1 Oligopeptide-binding protein AppA precursor [Sporosarcina pasteurii]
MLKRNHLLLMIILFMFGLVLAACSADEPDGEKGDGKATETTEEEKAASDGPKDGGTITGAMHTAPAGMFNPIFYEEAYEANILDFTHEGLTSQNESLEFIPKLAKSWETNEDQTEITFQLEEGVKWHDGEEFTADDVVFTYKAISDPDYVSAGGVRTNYVEPLLGYEEYASGETDEFVGVVADSDYQVTFKFEEPNIMPLYYTSFPIIPEHVFKDIPVAEIPEAAESLDAGKVIGTGPFKFTEMIEREQYILERHEDYWQGKPHLDKLVWKIVQQSVMTGLLEKGEIDFIALPGGIDPADFDMVNEYENVTMIEQPDFGYQILGFKHNHRTAEDVENGVINPDNWVPNEKIADPKVRQAIAWAIDRQGLIGEGHGQGLLHGHGELINSPIAVQFWAYDENAGMNYSYDPEKAMEMLDELGYVDVDGDGYREDPDGNEWVLNMEYPTGNQLREKSAPIIADNLDKVGIKVDLRQPKEMSVYVEGLTNDNSDWDLYLIGWNLGSGDPDPLGLWGIKDAYNFSRWNNPESDELLYDAVKAPNAFEQDYRVEKYREWQDLYSEDLPALILYAQNSIWAYNDRLQGVEVLPYTMYKDAHTWWVND